MTKPKCLYVDMVADLTHDGHARIIDHSRELASSLGINRVLVGIHSCDTVQTYKRRPVQSMKRRISNIEALGVEVVASAPLIVTADYCSLH